MPRKKKPGKRDAYADIVERAKTAKDPRQRMVIIAKSLTELKSGFDLADLKKVASLMGKESAEDMLDKLKENNLVYESAPGIFRSV